MCKPLLHLYNTFCSSMSLYTVSVTHHQGLTVRPLITWLISNLMAPFTVAPLFLVLMPPLPMGAMLSLTLRISFPCLDIMFAKTSVTWNTFMRLLVNLNLHSPQFYFLSCYIQQTSWRSSCDYANVSLSPPFNWTLVVAFPFGVTTSRKGIVCALTLCLQSIVE